MVSNPAPPKTALSQGRTTRCGSTGLPQISGMPPNANPYTAVPSGGLLAPHVRPAIMRRGLGRNELDEEIVGIGTTRHQGRNGRIPLLIGLCREQVATTQRDLRRR